ncbi:hypothetical protein GE061_000291 [Apolygus lucorum]|uniref:Uncharacterized protein n=1 Tax=Apolygus lucorum TaxID=248454 RepID=A0A6A4KI74_APOLU|nr:hypothetical protein GE061_000291 [Apolygus lucorum]
MVTRTAGNKNSLVGRDSVRFLSIFAKEADKMVLTQEKIKNCTPIGKKPKKSSFIPRTQYEETEMMAAINAVKDGTPEATELMVSLGLR